MRSQLRINTSNVVVRTQRPAKVLSEFLTGRSSRKYRYAIAIYAAFEPLAGFSAMVGGTCVVVLARLLSALIFSPYIQNNTILELLVSSRRANGRETRSLRRSADTQAKRC